MSHTGSEEHHISLSDLVTALPDSEHANAVKSPRSSMLDTLPPNIKKRVAFLEEIQSQHDELEKRFYQEREELEARYQRLYEPLYSKRFEVVNGITEVEGVVEEGDGAAKGVPEFWLNAMKTNETLAMQITERDEEALKYLKDIKSSKMEDPKGFKLEFVFNTNPFFNNEVLKKEYHMIEEIEPILERAVGTEIEWHAGKNLTQKVLRKKVKKGSKNTKPVTKTESCDSFFNFFSPPKVPEEDEEIDQDKAEELQDLMEQDYDIGSTIRDKVIPHAVSWYTGEAVEGEFEDADDISGDSDEDEDEEEEEDGEEDSEHEEDDRKS